jgi:hypothetical protein
MATLTQTTDRAPESRAGHSPLVAIARQEWATALNAFTRRHDGWLVTLDVLAPDQGPQREFENLPLLGVSADRVNHDGTIVISVSWSRIEHLTHFVPGVKGISVEQTSDGSDAALWIESSDGTTTVLRFRVAALPETVDGLVRP